MFSFSYENKVEFLVISKNPFPYTYYISICMLSISVNNLYDFWKQSGFSLAVFLLRLRHLTRSQVLKESRIKFIVQVFETVAQFNIVFYMRLDWHITNQLNHKTKYWFNNKIWMYIKIESQRDERDLRRRPTLDQLQKD